MRILVVEDDEDLAEVLVESLEEARYAVDLARHGGAAEELMTANRYDLVILDWKIPAPDGLELLRQWRAAGRDEPVLMLTGRREVSDRVDGLDTGADDYLTKPFSMMELMARVRSLLRRRSRTLRPLRAGEIVLEPASRRVTFAGEPLKLTPKEFGVLEYLLSRAGEIVSRTELTEHVWDDSFDAMSNVVDVIMYRLRKKIDGGRSAKLLHTIKGVGYVLRTERGES
ncbi:MAG: DNA-binding response regulator [Acidobacteria bacterium]|nr:MAG: DNA-binding response regulator [Acidobacteriota bacterium]